MELTSLVEPKGVFTQYYPTWFQAQDLLEVLRDAMRVELGLKEMDSMTPPHARTLVAGGLRPVCPPSTAQVRDRGLRSSAYARSSRTPIDCRCFNRFEP